MMTQEDKDLLTRKGISEAQIAEQLACFEKGFPYLKLYAAASVGNGILAPDTDEQKKYLDAWEAYTQTDKTVVKFVPASGAASRMFKNLFEFLGADYDVPTTDFEKKFFDRIADFAFYQDLNAACQKTEGKDIAALVAEGNYKAVVAALLQAAGLNYGALPKGLLKFHKYEDGNRTPVEEHLVEGALYAANRNGKVNVQPPSMPSVTGWTIISLSPSRSPAPTPSPPTWTTSPSATTASCSSVRAGTAH